MAGASIETTLELWASSLREVKASVNRRANGTPDRRRIGAPLAMMRVLVGMGDSRDACAAGKA